MRDAKVSKDGTVTVNGTVIGSVTKEELSLTITEQIMRTTSVYWVPRNTDGETVANPQRTRKAAVSLLEKVTRPTSVTDIRTETSWAGEEFISAVVNYAGNTYCVSRYPFEDNWIVDARFGANGFPHWSNGAGTRVTAAYALKGELADTVTSAVTAHFAS